MLTEARQIGDSRHVLYTSRMTFPRAAWAVVSTLAFTLACGSSDPGTPSGGAGSAGAEAAGANGVAGGGGETAGGSAVAGGDAGGAASGAGGAASVAGAAGGGGVPGGAGAAGGGAAGANGGASAGSAGHAGSAGSSGAGAGGANAGPPSSRQTAKPLGGGNTAPNGYFEYLPPGYNGATATPLLVFWHGIGEDGNGASDLQKVLAHGPPELISKDKWDNARPFIVLSPQYTPTSGEIMAGGGCPSSATIDAFFTWAALHYPIDAKRVYLTGLSCGAIGSWDYLAQHQASVVAAAVLLSGNPGVPTQAGSAWARAGCSLGAVAIWSLHGDMDPTVPYAPDHDTVTDLLACPAPPRRAAMFTDVVNGQHDIWDPTYDLSAGHGDIYKWMLDNAK
jgi:predicted esterase